MQAVQDSDDRFRRADLVALLGCFGDVLRWVSPGAAGALAAAVVPREMLMVAAGLAVGALLLFWLVLGLVSAPLTQLARKLDALSQGRQTTYEGRRGGYREVGLLSDATARLQIERGAPPSPPPVPTGK